MTMGQLALMTGGWLGGVGGGGQWPQREVSCDAQRGGQAASGTGSDGPGPHGKTTPRTDEKGTEQEVKVHLQGPPCICHTPSVRAHSDRLRGRLHYGVHVWTKGCALDRSQKPCSMIFLLCFTSVLLPYLLVEV